MKWLGVAAASLIAASAGARDVASIDVTSPAFINGGSIPSEYTCDGRGGSPSLSWSAVPADTKSIAVIVEDPDAPGGTYEHLTLFNLQPSQRSLASRSSDFKPICPPSGRHHYKFEVLALDSSQVDPMSAGAADIATATQGHVLARGELTGFYQRLPR
jgi:phosphatidylethanolamine-binding protein (PEBP) family uncharacterized protein